MTAKKDHENCRSDDQQGPAAGDTAGAEAASRAQSQPSRTRFRRPSFRLAKSINSGAPLLAGFGPSSRRRRRINNDGDGDVPSNLTAAITAAPPSGHGGQRTMPLPEQGSLNGDVPTIDLHEKFLSCASLSEIRDIFHCACEQQSGGANAAAAKADDHGRLPLHCIALNRDLILLSTGGAAAAIARVDQFILRELLPAHPVAVIEEDDEGSIPFAQVIMDWIVARRAVRRLNVGIEVKKKKEEEMMKKVAKKMMKNLPRKEAEYHSGSDVESDESIDPALLHEKVDGNNGESNADDDEEVHDFPPLVEWSLRMLSSIIDRSSDGQLGCIGSNLSLQNEIQNSKNTLSRNMSDASLFGAGSEGSEDGGSGFRRSVVASARVSISVGSLYDEIIVEKIAAIPHLLEELLLVEDSSARKRAFDLSIIHKVLLCPASLGDGAWLIKMLCAGMHLGSGNERKALLNVFSRHSHSMKSLLWSSAMEESVFGRRAAEGATFYLECLQTINIQDDLTVAHHVRQQQHITGEQSLMNMVSKSDVKHFKKQRDDLYDRVGYVEGLIRTICVLDTDLLARASNTQVIQRFLDKQIFSPIALYQAFFDGVAHILMVISYRLGPASALFQISTSDASFRPHQYLLSNMLLMACILWFVSKEIQVLLAKYALSPWLFWSDALSFWTFLDVVPVALTAICALEVDYLLRSRAFSGIENNYIPFGLRVAVALTTPLLWLRILVHAKMFNQQLATFILSSVEIVKDIKWFLVVLFVAVVSFAQMFISLTYEPQNPALEGVEYHYFSLESYLRAYTLMLGDLDAASLKNSLSIVLLFVFYTLLVTVVLLNILIAIVSESYVNAAVSSKRLLGEARVMFVAELLSLNLFHRLWTEGKIGTLRKNLTLAFIFAGALFTKSIVQTIKEKLICMNAELSPWSFGILEAEAVVGYCVMIATIILLRTTTIHVHNRFGVYKGVDILPDSKWVNSIDAWVQYVATFISRRIDSLSEEDEDELVEGPKGVGTSGRLHTDHQLHRALAATRRELKKEMKRTVDDLRIILRDQEESSAAEMKSLQESLASIVSSAVDGDRNRRGGGTYCRRNCGEDGQ